MSSGTPAIIGGTDTRTRSGRLARLGLVTLAYFAVIKLGAALFTSPTGLQSLLPSAGFLLGWVLRTERREWPLIAAFAGVAHGVAAPLFLSAPLTAVGPAAAEVVATLACAMIMGGGRAEPPLASLTRFFLGALFVSAPVYSAIATLLSSGDHSGRMLAANGFAYLVGVLVVAPVILTAEESARWIRQAAPRARAELFLAMMVITTMVSLAYIVTFPDQELLRPLNVLLVLPLIWTGLRIDVFAAAWGNAVTGIVIGYATTRGTGLFAILPGDDLRHHLYAAIYTTVAAVLGLTNATIVGGLRRALATLAATEKWFRELANASPLPMIAIEADQTTLFFNTALVKLYGYTREDVGTVEALWRRIIPDVTERHSVTREWYARVEEARRNGVPVRPLEYRGLAADGTYRYVESHGSEIGGRRIILLVDRTADREAQLARRSGELLFRQLIDSAPIPIMVIEADHQTLRINRAFTELLGYDGAEMPTVDAYLERVFPDPAYRKKMDTTWRQHLAEWRATAGPFRPVTAQFTCKDGTVVFLEVRTSQVGDRRINTLMDLTERQRADAALRASETQFRAMFDSSAIAISLVDLTGRPMKTNRALTQLLGFTEQELCTKSWMALTHPEDLESDIVLFDELISGKRDTYQIEKRYIRKDRAIVSVRVTLSLIRDARGQPDFYVSMVEDISKRTELEEALRQAQKMEAVGQLTSGISHDFNNLLSIIIGNIELVTTQLGTEATSVERELSDASEAAQRGAEMIRKLLGFSRQAELRKEPVNLSAVVSGFVRMLRRLLPSDIEIKITLDPNADALTVRADVGAVEQIMVNLATNARDAMPRGGSIEIKIERGEVSEEQRASRAWLTESTYVALSVTDSGTGMDSATMAMVFEPFFTTKAEGKGTGLGMAMIDGLAKQHEGFVEVRSELGRGTTVSVWFPVVPEGAWTFEGLGPDTSEIRGGTETILLVEDKEALRRVTKRLLEGLGYSVIPAADGAQALKLYNRNRDRVDLVVTDMVMPKLHGHELYRAVRETGSTVPFVFASGYSPAELRSRAALGEDVKHLPKPVTLETLAKAIRAALNPVDLRPPAESLRESVLDP